jgi:predicted acylesterase/phospholipase RssA
MQNIAIFEKLRALLARKEAAPLIERSAAELIPFARKGKARAVAFALQGGGAHGAFTWGVLDRALEEGLKLEAISGTSAGAINAAVLASAHAQGGAPTRTRLAAFWQALAQVARMSPLRPPCPARRPAAISNSQRPRSCATCSRAWFRPISSTRSM